MSRFYSKLPSFRLALGTKSTLPALLAYRAQILPTSPIPRTAFFLQRQPFQFNVYSTDSGGGSFDNATGDSLFPPSPVIYIGNMPYEATADDVKATFAEFEGMKRITFGVQPDGRSRGFAHVEFESVEQATAAVDAHQASPFVVGNRTVTVAYGGRRDTQGARRGFKQDLAPSNCLYVGNLPFQAAEEDVRNALGELGTIVGIRLGYDFQGRSKGFAHVDFESVDEAERVFEYYQSSPINILGRDVRLDRATPPVAEHPPSPRLYYRGFHGSAAELREAMGEFGSQIIDLVQLKNMESGTQTGSGFMQFGSKEVAEAAMKAVHGRPIAGSEKFEVAYAKPRELRDGRPNTGSRGGFGLRDGRRSSRDDAGKWGNDRDSRMPVDSYGSGWKNGRQSSNGWGR